MAQTDHVICQQLCLIDGFLHSLIQLLTIVAAQNIIDVALLALVHEVSRSGLGEGLGRGDAHKCDHAAADGKVLDIRQNAIAQRQIDPVAGEVREICLSHRLFCTGHAVVEFMVAGRSNIIACGIHQLDDRGTFVHGTISSALNMVACVHQQNVLACILIALFQGGNSGIGQFRRLFVDVGVDIVGVKNGDVLHAAREAGRCSGSTKAHGSNGCGDACGLHKAAAGDKLFHEKRPPLRTFLFSSGVQIQPDTCCIKHNIYAAQEQAKTTQFIQI